MIKVTDKSGKFIQMSEDALDEVYALAAKDILLLSRTRVPLGVNKSNKKSGNRNITSRGSGLQGSSKTVRLEKMQHMVIYNKEYAGYQEYGQRKDGSYKVRKYSVPGRQKHYLLSAGQDITAQTIIRIKAKVRTIRV